MSDAVRLDWKSYALKLALVAAERSEDPFMKVGACVLRHDNSVAGIGYNGAPSGVELNWNDRNQRRVRVVHAEVNALRYVKPNECWLLACTHLPCNDCLKSAASYGITEVIFNDVYIRDMSSLDIAHEFGIKLFCSAEGAKRISVEYNDKVKVIGE